ncbi:MAG: FecCD family ABC transporter permease [Planctomycetota bacterium]
MKSFTPRRFALAISLCAAAVLTAVLVSPGIAVRPPGVIQAWQSLGDAEDTSHYRNIAFRLRLPRTLKALVAGVTLALCGAVFQTLFRNPLATPYTLGIASGGSLGALIGIKLGVAGTLLWASGVMACAFAGSAAVVVGVVLLARATRGLSSNSLLLGGVTIGFFCSALMMFVQYLADEHEALAIIRWMMGSVAAVGNEDLFRALPFVVVAWAALLMQARALNQYSLGEEIAATRGVNPARLQAVCIGFASLATAAVVSMCGPIGFVGLIIPHAARRLFGHDLRLLLAVSGLLGGAFLIVCDWLTVFLPVICGHLTGRQLSAVRLPIGVVTALVGAPLFLGILRRTLR